MGCHSPLPGGVRASERLGAQDDSRGQRIPPEEQELIFDRFYQLQSNKLSQRGTGIGFWVTMAAASGPVRKLGDTQEVAS
jgi:K+-sensing histidine kinase KdpD